MRRQRSAGVRKPSRRTGRGQEALPQVYERSGVPSEGQQWLGDSPRGQAWVGRPSQRSGSGREALPEGHQGSERPPSQQAEVEQPSRWTSRGQETPRGPGVVGWPSLRARSGQEVLPESQKGSEGPPGGPAVVGRPSQRDGRGREGYGGPLGVPEGVGCPSRGSVWVRRPSQRAGRDWMAPGGTGEVERTSQRTRSGREALAEGWQGSKGPPGGPSGVRTPFRRTGKFREDLPESRQR